MNKNCEQSKICSVFSGVTKNAITPAAPLFKMYFVFGSLLAPSKVHRKQTEGY